MGRIAKESGGGNFEDPPTGTHAAICVKLIDLGTQHDEYQGKPTVHEKVFVQWELPNEKMQDGRPFVVGAFLTNSLSEKATLRHWLEAWRGRPFTSAELAGFDLENVLGKGCMLNIVSKGAGKSGTKVSGVMALPRGSAVPEPENKPSAFWLDPFDPAAFDQLRDGLKDIIKKSDEYAFIERGEKKPANGGGTFDDMKDDIPF